MTTEKFPPPGRMLDDLSAKFDHETLQDMIATEVIRDPWTLRMQHVANLWRKHCAPQP